MNMKTGYRGKGKGKRWFLVLSPNTFNLKPNERGFTLLLAALVASIVLALGTAIFEIAQKQVTLSSIGRDSQFAFYAADTIAECALYWDFRAGYFGTTTPPGLDLQTVKCDTSCLNESGPGQCTDVEGRSDIYPYTITSLPINLFQDSSQGGPFCAVVKVTKCDGPISTDGVCAHATPPTIHTVVHADGYIVDCDSISTNPRALQRSVELRY